MNGIDPFDLVCPVQNLLTGPRVCAGCGGTLPPFTPFRDRPGRPDPHAACRKRLETEQAVKADAALAEANADWTMYRERYYAGQPLILRVLDLHRPISGHTGPGCAECEQSDGMESTESVPWPCATYTALTSRPATADGCGPECGPVELGDAVDIEVPAEGVHPVYALVFTPDEILPVRAAARAAGKTTNAYLHDLAIETSAPAGEPVGLELIADTTPAPVTVNITVQGSQPPHDAINQQLLAEYRAYQSHFRR